MKRIAILDGLRVFAILFVLFGHYLGVYDYEKNIFLKFIRDNGYFGVPMFFIISGFVILYSLENTNKYSEYLKKRYIRLAPAMFICSTITFLFFKFIYTGTGYIASSYFPNWLIANTFIDPNVFNALINKPKFYYIDNAYWSLWVEVCFYIIIGYLYFRNKENYIQKYVIICIIGIFIYLILRSSLVHSYLGDYISASTLKHMNLIGRALVFFHDCLWFLIGMYLYKLYKDKTQKKYIYYMLIAAFFINFIERFDLTFAFLTIATLSVYFIFVFKPNFLSLLSNKFIGKLGVSSYSVYLIHYHLGVVAITAINGYINKESYITMFLIIILCFSFGLFSYKYLEKPLSSKIKKILFKN